MEKVGLLQIVMPELAQTRHVKQDGNHDFDVFDHSIYSCDAAPHDNSAVRMAALFHDIGKPKARAEMADGTVVFHRHEEMSEELAKRILRRLKYAKKMEARVCHLIGQHMFSYNSSWTDAAVRRFIKRVTLEAVDELFALRIADGYGMKNKPASAGSLRELALRIKKVIEKDSALSIKDLEINGNDLALFANIPKGPEMGIILNHLLETVLDDPTMNNRDALLIIATKFHQTYIARNG